MCLLMVAFRVIPGTPLLIGANRDEVLDRPAVAMSVLRSGAPRVLGGRDAQAGGTWLAVNEHGLFAGLTNQPLGDARDSSRRSRGELPLALASQSDARRGVAHFLDHHRTADYNGSWLLTGDRDSLFYIDFTGLVVPQAVALPPGLYVLENRPLGAPSPKVDRLTGALGPFRDTAAAVTTLAHVLADHSLPDPAGCDDGPKSTSNCVHLEGYGTRSSCIVRCGDDPGSDPQVSVADGPPCTVPFVDVSELWTVAAPSPR